MNDGGRSPRNEQEILEFVEKEKAAQEHMDVFYESRGHTIFDRTGNKEWDLILTVNGPEKRRQEKIEEKFRFNSWGNDILIEIVQDLSGKNWGWFHSTGCDYLHYVFCTENAKPYKLHRIKWKDGFKGWYLKHLGDEKKASAVISSKGYGLTINLCVSFKDIPEKFIEAFDIED